MADQVAERVAARHFEERYAQLLLAMSVPEAKSILGFPPASSPTPEEVAKAYKTKAFENHPDRGGDAKKMVEVNVAKDVLEGKSNRTWVGEPSPRRERPKPIEPDATIEGQDFNKAWSDSGAPPNTEWKFVSIPEWYWEKSFYPGHRAYVLYGQTDTKHIFLAIKERGESSGTIPTDKGQHTKIMEDWQSSMIDVPISQNIAKIAPKYIKQVGTTWADGAAPKPPRKFIAWPGGKPTEQILKHIPRSGGATLKDILLGTALLSDEDPAVAGRKSVVEVYTKYSKERYARMKQLKAEGKLTHVNAAHQYDFFVRVNGKTEQLSDDTIQKMERSFIPWVMSWEVAEGAPKNLTRMRGRGMLKFDAGTAIRELANCLTGEPSWLHIALEKAAEEWETPPAATKQAALQDLRENYTLFEAAKIAGMSSFELFRTLHPQPETGDMDPLALKVAARFERTAASLKKIPPYAGSTRWVVMDGDKEVGLVEKARSTRTDLLPYKAFAGIGHEAKFIGAFYDEAEAKKWGYDEARSRDHGDMKWGGMDAAVKAVEHAAH